MPLNNGRKPPHEFVDVMLRNGMIARGIKADGWRWKPWPTGPHDFDILRWRPSK